MLTTDKLITVQELLPKNVYIDWHSFGNEKYMSIRLVDKRNNCCLDEFICRDEDYYFTWQKTEKFIKSLLENGVI